MFCYSYLQLYLSTLKLERQVDTIMVILSRLEAPEPRRRVGMEPQDWLARWGHNAGGTESYKQIFKPESNL